MIEYVSGSAPRPVSSPDVEFVGGPRAGERIVMVSRPESLSAADGTYHRSVACADDDAQRYVWVPNMTSERDRPAART